MEKYLIEHCSPTLANIKPANLFTYSFSCVEEFERSMQNVNETLNKKGVFVESLRIRDGRSLIWVYRKSQLNERLRESKIKSFLQSFGYQSDELVDVIAHLKERISNVKGFPHEIGIFLGYPLADVVAFIKNGGKHSKCTGCWKVYTNECEALNLFKKYAKCKSIYAKMFLSGRTIKQLTIAA